MNDMTEAEKKLHFNTLVEDLYKQLKTVEEGTVPDKIDIVTKMIYDFYIENKEFYGLNNIEDVAKELDRVNKAHQKLKNEKDTEVR